MGTLAMGLVVGWMDYLWNSTTMRTTTLLLPLCRLRHNLYRLRDKLHLYHLDHQGPKPVSLDLLENVIQVFNDSYKWRAMMKRTSRCHLPRNLVLFATILGSQDIFCKQQACSHLQACLAIRDTCREEVMLILECVGGTVMTFLTSQTTSGTMMRNHQRAT